MRKLCFKIVLLCTSLLMTLLAVEVLVRVIRPDLAELARSDEKRHTYRIHANPRNQTRELTHPDTGEKHLVIRNSLGFRQHREFSPKKAPGTIRIGVFGDSFTENRRLPVAYCLTEPLQFLFDESGNKVEVLNFGTDGYGTDQAYLQYIQEGTALDLDHVVYIFCGNDLIDILANNLYSLNEEGELVYRPAKKANFFKRVAGRLATTYLVVQGTGAAKALMRGDGGNRSEFWSNSDYREDTIVTKEQEKANRDAIWSSWRSGTDGKQSHQDRSYQMLEAIIDKFRSEVTKRGQTFSILFLPKGIFKDDIIARFKEKGIPMLETEPLFAADLDDIETAFFENDPHWNEEGNKLAAVHLFRHLLPLINAEDPGDDFVRETLGAYYDVFGRGPVGSAWLAPPKKLREDADLIRMRFLELEERSESQTH